MSTLLWLDSDLVWLLEAAIIPRTCHNVFLDFPSLLLGTNVKTTHRKLKGCKGILKNKLFDDGPAKVLIGNAVSAGTANNALSIVDGQSNRRSLKVFRICVASYFVVGFVLTALALW